MKKHLLIGALFAASATGFMSCSDDNSPEPIPVEVSSGLYVINGGNKSANIPGSITALDYATLKVTQQAFFSRNQQHLGDTPNDAIIYGSKMYIAVYRSNIIWVVDPENMEILGSITPEGDAMNPRSLAAKDGKVYSSMYTGYVCKIDTVTLKIEQTVKVGPNPDQIAIGGNNLYVANSDGSQSKLGYPDSSVSIIDLTSFTERKIQVGQNPTDMVSNGSDVYVIVKGDYDSNPSVVKKIEGNSAREICFGTNFAMDNSTLYVINAPYSAVVDASAHSYRKYTASDGAFVGDMVDVGVDSPSGIEVDPLTGEILILSYQLSSTGGSLYREPAYGVIYSSAGTPQARFEAGVGAVSAVFLHKTVNMY